MKEVSKFGEEPEPESHARARADAVPRAIHYSWWASVSHLMSVARVSDFLFQVDENYRLSV